MLASTLVCKLAALVRDGATESDFAEAKRIVEAEEQARIDARQELFDKMVVSIRRGQKPLEAAANLYTECERAGIDGAASAFEARTFAEGVQAEALAAAKKMAETGATARDIAKMLISRYRFLPFDADTVGARVVVERENKTE